MADLNALIAQGAQFNMPDPLGQYAKMQQLQAGQQQMRTGALQEQSAGMQLQQLKEDRANMAKLSQKLSVKGVTPRQYFEALQSSGDTKYQQLGIEGLMKLDQTEKYDAFLRSQQTIPAQQAPAPMAGGLGADRGAFLPGVPAPTNALASQAAAPMASTNALAPTPAADPVAALETKIAQLRSFKDDRAQAEAARLQKQVDEYNKGQVLAPGSTFVVGRNPVFTAPEKTTPVKTIGTVNPSDFTPASVANFYKSGNYADLIAKPTKVAGDGTGVAKAPSGYRFTKSGDLEAIPGGPAAGKPLNAAQEIKRRDTLGKEFKSATSALQTTQDVLDSIAFVKSEPGLSRATGFTGTMLPSFPEGAAASADVRLANVKGKVTALGKAAAAASGAIGSIATVEWKILSDQIAAIDPVKGTGPLLAQLDLVEQQAQGAMSRIRDGYERQFGEDFERFPQFSNLPPPKSAVKPKTPAPAAAPNIDALVNKYLNPK